MDSSSTSAENSEATREFQAGVRRAKAGVRLTQVGLATGIALFVIGALIASPRLGTGEAIEAGRWASIELDDGTYFIYNQSPLPTHVEIVGESGPVELEDATESSTSTIDALHGRKTHSINIEKAGTFTVQNYGTDRIIIDEPISGVSRGLMIASIPIGLLLIAIGVVMTITGYLKHRRARKRGAVPKVRRHETEVTTHRTEGPNSARQTTIVTETFTDGHTSATRTTREVTETGGDNLRPVSEPQDDLDAQPEIKSDEPQDDLSSLEE